MPLEKNTPLTKSQKKAQKDFVQLREKYHTNLLLISADEITKTVTELFVAPLNRKKSSAQSFSDNDKSSAQIAYDNEWLFQKNCLILELKQQKKSLKNISDESSKKRKRDLQETKSTTTKMPAEKLNTRKSTPLFKESEQILRMKETRSGKTYHHAAKWAKVEDETSSSINSNSPALTDSTIFTPNESPTESYSTPHLSHIGFFAQAPAPAKEETYATIPKPGKPLTSIPVKEDNISANRPTANIVIEGIDEWMTHFSEFFAADVIKHPGSQLAMKNLDSMYSIEGGAIAESYYYLLSNAMSSEDNINLWMLSFSKLFSLDITLHPGVISQLQQLETLYLGGADWRGLHKKLHCVLLRRDQECETQKALLRQGHTPEIFYTEGQSTEDEQIPSEPETSSVNTEDFLNPDYFNKFSK